jgi:methionine-rich copper-binding protein CopC
MAPPRSRLLKVFAGVLAMVSSLSMLAVLVVSDVAGATQGSPAPADDDTLDAHPVTITKVDHRKELEFEELLEAMAREQRERVRFGNLEGY